MANKFPEADARILLSSFNFEPLGEYPDKRKPWKSRCIKCGYEAAPILSNLENGLAGCANCAGLVITASKRKEVTEKARKFFDGNFLLRGSPFPVLQYLPGWIFIAGVIFIATSAFAVKHMGILNFVLSSVTGQLIGALLLDWLAPAANTTLSGYLVTGVFMTLGSILVSRYFEKRKA